MQIWDINRNRIGVTLQMSIICSDMELNKTILLAWKSKWFSCKYWEDSGNVQKFLEHLGHL